MSFFGTPLLTSCCIQISHTSPVDRNGTDSATFVSEFLCDSSFLGDAGILVACRSGILGKLSSDSLGTVTGKSTHHDTSGRLYVAAPYPTNRRDRRLQYRTDEYCPRLQD